MRIVILRYLVSKFRNNSMEMERLQRVRKTIFSGTII